jgi:hypothetical protein
MLLVQDVHNLLYKSMMRMYESRLANFFSLQIIFEIVFTSLEAGKRNRNSELDNILKIHEEQYETIFGGYPCNTEMSCSQEKHYFLTLRLLYNDIS